MTGTAARRQPVRSSAPSDEQLIGACLEGSKDAWSKLIDRYKNLIYSIPIRMGMQQEAGDIFQAVCVSLLSKLPQLREHRALPKWLMQTCYHECLRHQENAKRQVDLESAEVETWEAEESLPEELLLQLEEEQALRDAIAEMPERCSRMIHMLFYENPARPYDEVARELGLATGSIGFTRGRCLERLRKYLETRGF